MSKVIIGVDPGARGAICIMQDQKIIELFDMPTMTVKVGKSNKLRVSPELLASELRFFSDCARFAVIEAVTASPQQGVSSAFAFGQAFGILTGYFAGVGIPVQLVTPAKWKRDIGINASKDGARLKATQIWPEDAGEFKRVKDDGRAESALIALWGERFGR